MTRTLSINGSVHIETDAGHTLQHAGKGKPRQLICHRCDERLFIEGETFDDRVEHLRQIIAEHGGASCP
jgi:hypothetical protein